jgi:excisionase family DNA binding protein
MEELLTVEELSDKLKVGKSTVYRWVHYDYIPYVKLGGAVRFNKVAVEKWLKSRERNGRNRLLAENMEW